MSDLLGNWGFCPEKAAESEVVKASKISYLHEMIEYVESLLQHFEQRKSRSTAISPITLLMGTILTAFAILMHSGIPVWLQVFFAVVVAALLILFIAAYSYFAWTNPDALRSERYTLSKLAIEKSAKGDDVTGIIEGEVIPKMTPAAITEEKR